MTPIDTNGVAAAITQAASDPSVVTAFQQGLLLGAVIVAVLLSFSLVRTMVEEKEEL